MRIVHVLETIDPATGGPPAVCVRLAAAQAAAGHDVDVLYYEQEGAAERISEAIRRIPHIDQVRRHSQKKTGWTESIFARDARREVARLVHDAEFVHLHGIWNPILRTAAQEAHIAGVPYCVRPAGMLDPWSLQQKPLKKRLAMALGYRTMLDRAAFIHTLNSDETDLILPLGLQSPLIVIPNGVFLEEIEPLPPRGLFRSTVAGLHDAPFVLFLSRLHHKKGLDHLARAFAVVAQRMPDVHLVVAGPDDGALGEFQEIISHDGLNHRVHLAGPLFGLHKLSAMVDASCFCLPSRQEGFSVAVIEALACGLPSVISPECHFPEVETSGAGFVCQRDPESLAGGIVSILADPQLQTDMKRAARELIRSRYTWPEIARQTIDAYEQVLQAHPPRSTLDRAACGHSV